MKVFDAIKTGASATGKWIGSHKKIVAAGTLTILAGIGTAVGVKVKKGSATQAEPSEDNEPSTEE